MSDEFFLKDEEGEVLAQRAALHDCFGAEFGADSIGCALGFAAFFGAGVQQVSGEVRGRVSAES